MKSEVSEALLVLELIIMLFLMCSSQNVSCAGHSKKVANLTFSETKSFEERSFRRSLPALFRG
jgi:hypothetical protein